MIWMEGKGIEGEEACGGAGQPKQIAFHLSVNSRI